MTETTQFYRCMICARFIEMTEFLAACRSKCKCGSGRFMPTVVTRWEAFKYLITHLKVLYATIKFRLTGRE